jgi:hypothetical protein
MVGFYVGMKMCRPTKIGQDIFVFYVILGMMK